MVVIGVCSRHIICLFAVNQLHIDLDVGVFDDPSWHCRPLRSTKHLTASGPNVSTERFEEPSRGHAARVDDALVGAVAKSLFV